MLKEGIEPIPGYRLRQFLGRGQFGEVWRASSPGGTQVALKFLNVRERQGRKEFRAVQKVKGIRHPHLVQTYALWLLDEQLQVIDDAAFDFDSSMLMDSVRGTMLATPKMAEAHAKPSWLVIATVLCEQNLMERLRECTAQGLTGIPAQELFAYMEGVAKAIDFLNAPRHELGEGPVAIHHCDIKPENLMTIGGLAVVGDFGVARILRSGTGDSRATSMGVSIAYAPPETFDNRTEATSDQYALAITYYELRTGKLPFPEDSAAQVMQRKISGKLDFSLVPPLEAKVLLRASAADPTKRYESAGQFVDQLYDAVFGKAKPTGSPTRSLVKFAALVTLFVALGAIGFIAAKQFMPRDDRKGDNSQASSGDDNKSSGDSASNGSKLPSVDYGKLFDEQLAEFLTSSEPSPDAFLAKFLEQSNSTKFDPDLIAPQFTDTEPIDDRAFPEDSVALNAEAIRVAKFSNTSLSIRTLSSDVTSHSKVENVGELSKIVWQGESLLLLNREGKVFSVQDAGSNANEGPIRATPIEAGSSSPSKGKIASVSSGGNSRVVVGLVSEPGKKIAANGFQQTPNRVVALVSIQGEPPLISLIVKLSIADDDGFRFASDSLGKNFIVSRVNGEVNRALLAVDALEGRLENFSNNAELSEIESIEDTALISDSGPFLIVANARSDQGLERRLLRFTPDAPSWRMERLNIGDNVSIGSIFPGTNNRVWSIHGSKLLSLTLPTEADSDNALIIPSEWIDFEFQSGSEIESAVPNVVCSLNNDWVIVGLSSGTICMVHTARNEVAPFAVCAPLVRALSIGEAAVAQRPSEVRQVLVSGTNVIVVQKNGNVLVYDSRRMLFHAEYYLRAKRSPPVQAPTNSIRG